MKSGIHLPSNAYTSGRLAADTAYGMRRYREHLRDAKRVAEGKPVQNHFKAGTIRKIVDMGANPLYLVVGEFDTESEAHVEEKRLVEYYGRRGIINAGTLTNLTDGGEGSSGKIFSPESIRKMVASKKGVPLSEERREQFRISRLNIKKKRGTKPGTKMSDDHKKKLSEAKKGVSLGPLSAETKAKLSAALKGKNLGKVHSEEARLKMSIASKGRILTEEQRKKISEALKGRQGSNTGKILGPRSDEVKAKISASNKGRKRTPEQKMRMSLGHQKRNIQ